MRVIWAKDFKLIVLQYDKVLISTPLQTFMLQGIGSSTRQIAYIIEEVEKGNVDSLTDLASLFYTYKNEYKLKQVVELVPTRIERHL